MFRKAEFQIKNSKDGQQYFVLKAPNGETILVSETYKSSAGVRNGIKSVMTNCKRKGAFSKFKDVSGELRFTLKAKNNKVIGQSEGYKTRFGRLIGIASVKINAPTAEIVED